MWPSFPTKLRYCIIFGTTRNPVKIQQKFISCDSWYSSPTKKPLVQDTTAVILGNFVLNHIHKLFVKKNFFLTFFRMGSISTESCSKIYSIIFF